MDYTGPTAFVLVAGVFVPIAFGGDVEEVDFPEFTASTSMEGRQAVSVRLVASRQWAVQGRGHLGMARNLELLRSGMYGRGPFEWIPPLAQLTNLLPPGGGFPGTALGPGTASDGLIVPLVNPSAYTASVPVKAGVHVTAGLYLQGTGTVRLEWLDAAGTFFSSTNMAVNNPVLARSTVTVVPPAGAVRCRLRPIAFPAVGAPSITWTPTVEPYMPPAGCAQAFLVIEPRTWSVIRTPTEKTLVGINFKVLEVG